MSTELEEFKLALLATSKPDARRLLDAHGGTTLERVEELVVPALVSLGEEWEAGRASLSQV